jgi:hypothetical protein
MSKILTEAKYIKNPEVIKMLKERSGIDADKLKFFEGFLTRLEIIRNKIRKMEPTGDKVMDKYINRLQSNEIMKTNFINTFNVNPKKEESVKKMGEFINSYIELIYKLDYKKRLGLNNKLEESNIREDDNDKFLQTLKQYSSKNTKKKRNSLGLKKSSMKFISDLMKLFQHMYELKKTKEVKQESHKKNNPLLTEEINKIKGLMFKIS